MKTKIAMSLTVVALAIAFSSSAMTASDSESSDFNVTVRDSLQINVAPDTMVYSADPGSLNESSAEGYDGVEIENSGSLNITNIYLSTSLPADRPFGSGAASEYNAGNFIQAKVTQSDIGGTTDNPSGNQFAFVTRRDYNESNDLSYFTEPGTADGSVRYGRIRVANESFFWAIDSVTSTPQNRNGCGGGGGDETFWIGMHPQSESETGTVDFGGDNKNNYWNKSITDGPGSWGVVHDVPLNTTESGPEGVNHTITTWCGGPAAGAGPDYNNQTFVEAHRWDPKTDSGEDLTTVDSAERILNASNDADELQPGEHFTLQTRVAVPFGTANGDVSQGQLTVNVNNN